jgi:hypothetical protein
MARVKKYTRSPRLEAMDKLPYQLEIKGGLRELVSLMDEHEDVKHKLNGQKHWTGENYDSMVAKIKNGEPEKVEQARGLLESLEYDMQAQEALATPAWQDSVCGAFPNVPAYLSGAHECMRQKVLGEPNKPSVTVWLDVTSSASISYKDLQTRGLSALALVMKLQLENYHVNLGTFTSQGGARGRFFIDKTYNENNDMPTRNSEGAGCVIVHHDVTQIDISEVAMILTNQGYSRGICYGLNYALLDGNGFFTSGAGAHGGSMTDRIRLARGRQLKDIAKPTDIILPLVYGNDMSSNDKNSLVWTNPPLWIANCLNEVKAMQGGGYEL